MEDKKPEPDLEAHVGGRLRIGQIQAAYIAAVREKYGRYPVPKGAKPLKGKSKVKVPKIPDYTKMKAEEFYKLAMNRADERRRLNPQMPRFWRKANWTSERRTKENLRRKPVQ